MEHENAKAIDIQARNKKIEFIARIILVQNSTWYLSYLFGLLNLDKPGNQEQSSSFDFPQTPEE